MKKEYRINRNKGQLVFSFSKYNFTFVLIFLAIFIIAYLLLGYSLKKSIENKSIPVYNIINGVESSINKVDFKSIEDLGGFVEILDEDRNIIRSYGKCDEVRGYYTEIQLLDELVNNNKNNKYYTWINNLNEDGKNLIAVIRIPKNKMTYQFKLTKVPYSIGKHIYKSYIVVLIGAIIIGLISVIIYSIFTAKRIKRPLRKIDNALAKITEGDYNQSLDLDEVKEFVIVGDTINLLIDKLKKSNEENKRLTESRSRMLMDLSHDIKTPITTIRGFSAALYNGVVDDKEQIDRYYKTIYNKAERVGELVDDLFEFVKLNDKNYVMVLEPVDICEFLRQIILKYIDELEEKNFEIDINIPEEEVIVDIDAKMFKRVITNLIENSIKYNEPGTRLRVELKEFNNYIIIEVADNGVGIDVGVRESIFDAFVRGDKSRKSDGGTGLGLSIAQKIIDRHNGEIKLLEPTDEEKTIFSIKLFRG